jgi:electron transfer flavoprotein alpha subunit
MLKIVCYLPIDNGIRLNKNAWGLYHAAKRLADQRSAELISIVVHAGLPESDIACLPFDEVYYTKLNQEKWYLADAQLHAFESALTQLNIEEGLFLFSSQPLYQEIAIRLSVRHQMGIITNVIEMELAQSDQSLAVKRSIYNGKADEWLKLSSTVNPIITLDRAVLYGIPTAGRAKKMVEYQVSKMEAGPITFVKESVLTLEELKITEARCVIGIGRGVYGGNSADFESIIKLSEFLNAPIGGSRVADELGLIPRDKRIGSSGHSIEADIYIAIGISGSSQHLAGIGGVKRVVAINNDAAAPIFQRCDIGIVGDFREGARLLVEAFKSER